MFSGLKKLSTVCIVLSILSCFSSIYIILETVIGSFLKICIITTSILFICLSISVRKIAGDMDIIMKYMDERFGQIDKENLNKRTIFH